MRNLLITVAAATLAALPGLARADPGYYVVTPYDMAGQGLAELRYWTTKSQGKPEVVWPELGLAWGLNSRWTTGVLLSGVGASVGTSKLSSINWSNTVLLTQGEWPLDVALHLQAIRTQPQPHDHHLEFGPLLQTDVGRTQLNLNLLFDRVWSPARADGIQLKYQWQLRYRWGPAVHVGLTGFGELGPWDEWLPADRQSHRAGPAVFFTLRPQAGRVLKLQAAWLEGKTFAARGHMFTLRAHGEF